MNDVTNFYNDVTIEPLKADNLCLQRLRCTKAEDGQYFPHLPFLKNFRSKKRNSQQKAWYLQFL